MYISDSAYNFGVMPTSETSVSPCGCKQGLGCCGGMGALTFDGSGILGSGLFAGGTSLSNWTWAEYAVAGIGVLVLFKLFASGQRVVATGRRKTRAFARA